MKEEEKKPYKRNKELCWKCKYHTYMGNLSQGKTFETMTELERSNIACYYSVMNNETCLKRDGKYMRDSRGTDYSTCNKFVEEPKEKANSTNSTFGKWVII